MLNIRTNASLPTIADYTTDFHKNGFTVVRGALSFEQAEDLRKSVQRRFDETPEDGYGSIVRTRMFEHGILFEDLMEQPVVSDIAEALLGDNCHMFSMNAIITPKGTGVDGWHVDEELLFPLPEDIEWNNHIQMPVFMISCIYYLVDVDETMGPTQLIPGSHRSGRHPDHNENPPLYKEVEPVTIVAQKGDCLMFNGQTWHRGARNESDRPRIAQQITYGKRWISQRFYPFINYVMPQDVIDRCKQNPRRARLLGLHNRGPYG